MKKKSYIFFIIVIFSTLLIGCSVKLKNVTINNFTVTIKKPNLYYYTNIVSKLLFSNTKLNVKLLDTNFYKEMELSKDDIATIKDFTKALKLYNFIEKPKDLPQKPAYKLFFIFEKEKYIINVYNEKYISVYPWDGIYSMDYIDMTGTQNLYNLYGLSKYLIPRK